MPAPLGNKNAARSRDFRDALVWALENYHNREEALAKLLPSKRPLFEITMGIVDAAMRNIPEGSDEDAVRKLILQGTDAWKFAVSTLGDRLDGKPNQSMDLGVDAEGNERPTSIDVNFVGPKGD